MSNLPDWLVSIIVVFYPGFAGPMITEYNGYAEADYVYVAPAAAGRIVEINAEEGATIAAGAVLFRIDDTHQTTALRAAEAQVAVARATLDNLATGSRAAEIDVIRATLAQAEADQRLARLTLERSQNLLASGAVTQARIDGDTAALQGADARVAQLQAQLQVAELPARDAQRIGAEAALEAALAQADDARLALKDRTVFAPADGVVDEVFYAVGEVAGAGAPVVAILPENSLKALFYIPESDRAQLWLGQEFAVQCSGCPDGITARLLRIAPSPQYTPPIIYSRAERTRLVFRAEAEILNAAGLLPGQPLTLRP